MAIANSNFIILLTTVLLILIGDKRALGIRTPDRISEPVRLNPPTNQPLKTAVFALGSFWRSESVFGCLYGVVRTTVGYAGGSKINPGYRSLGNHAECVQVEYDPRLTSFGQLLEVFWSSHDSRQVFGQGPDVGDQYRSIVFTNGTEEYKLAAASKEREQARSRSSVVTTQLQPLETFYPAEPEHQKFELKRTPFLLQLIGNLPEEELGMSSLATKLNGYAPELCPPKIQKQIDAKINDIVRKGWPILRELYVSKIESSDRKRKKEASSSSISSTDRTDRHLHNYNQNKRTKGSKKTKTSSSGNNQVRASHILIKHQGSRRKSSWKDAEGRLIINTTRDSAVSQLKTFRDDIVSGKAKFEDIASRYSDCSSAKRGGDLGPFGRGQMQKPFEEATFALKVGEISEIVDTDSGVHIIMRTS